MKFILLLVIFIGCRSMLQIENAAVSSCLASYPRGDARVDFCLAGVQRAKQVFSEKLNRDSTYIDLLQVTYETEKTCPDDDHYVDCSFGVRLVKEHIEMRYR